LRSRSPGAVVVISLFLHRLQESGRLVVRWACGYGWQSGSESGTVPSMK
jgi:hypothetical protein